MKKPKHKTVDPQIVKAALLKAAGRIGNRRRRISAAELFELIVECSGT